VSTEDYVYGLLKGMLLGFLLALFVAGTLILL
jgi:hypothetical protein